MRIYICDDDATFAEVLEKQLRCRMQEACGSLQINRCSMGQEVLHLCKQQWPDLVFLDIDMPEIDGFSLAQRLREDTRPLIIVFITSLHDLVFQSFQYNPFWFLRKGHMEELDAIVQKLTQRYLQSRQTFPLKTAEETRMIRLEEISYFESEGHYVNLFVGDEKIRFKEKMGQLEQQLCSKDFIRIHIGYLVNASQIRKLGHGELVLKNGQILPVSRSRLQQTQQAFMRYMRSIR